MAIFKAETMQGFSQLPALRQLGLMIGLAASVALGVAIVLWSQTPNYGLLYSNLSGKSASQVIESLQKVNIRYKLDPSSGAIMVPTADLHKARIHLAKEGLPQGTSMGMEFLNKEESFKTSKFTQYRRYVRALEIELARSIATMRNIQSARVHLALPEQTVFVGRESSEPKATVVLSLYGGRSIGYGQVKAILHMVSSSIPKLESKNVSIIDQYGKLLSRARGTDAMSMSEEQFDYKARQEHAYIKKIEDIISPIVGEGRVRAKVNVELDFTATEQTRESYNSDSPAVRSEKITERRNTGSATPSGIPGATSNQPPKTGTTTPSTKKTAARTQSSLQSQTKSVTRNYLPDKTISHIRNMPGSIRRLSIAVLVDDKRSVDEEGEVTKTPLTKQELASLTELVKSAVGFDERRGDTIKIQNASFYTPPPPQALPETPLLEQPWVMDVGKQALGAIAVLILFFAVLRPVMKSLAEKAVEAPVAAPTAALPQAADPAAAPQAQLPHQSKYEESLNVAKTMVGQDPGRVAQVVKSWVAKDG